MQCVAERSVPVGLRERKKQATRAALGEAAVRLAVARGVENVTVEAISAEVGVSPRTFFNYFDQRDDAFVMIDDELSERVRHAVLAAPAELSPLDAVRDALIAELVDVEARHGLWQLRAEVLRQAPHLLVRSLGAHTADEFGLATAVARRLHPATGDAGAPASGESADVTDAYDVDPAAVGLYPRLVAAMAGTAVRVAIEHWSTRSAEAFQPIFHSAFTQLAAGLPAPTAEDRGPVG
ncbi:TetR/AcrR family transcriptional regulator [Streptomyces hainanensis]|uniref:TetR family transcriptional regulator n=1 Tax=Streptomyces hainanensis TaxID=402648 RepID=A0A4R4SKY6_9ACTN|nr:TetR/AcrR family transcriptional regulator [Streptomyces hainanensis]TDC62909.1 TetR family transcriptional regulator [Streptomyces hainanensis]